jgi:hypothetical protein
LLVGLLITIGLPAGLVRLIHTRTHIPVAVPLLGALFGMLGLAVSLPITAYLWPLSFGARTSTTVLLTAVTSGLCQELARYAAFRYAKPLRDRRDHAGALAAGVGHAAVASVLTGIQFVGGLALLLFLPRMFDAGTRQQMLTENGAPIALAALSQLPLVACSLAFSVLVVLAQRRSLIYLALAIVAHIGLLWAVSSLSYAWSLAVLCLAGGLSLMLVAAVLRTGIIAPPPHTPEPEPVDRGVRL